jgi:hypothetical protein
LGAFGLGARRGRRINCAVRETMACVTLGTGAPKFIMRRSSALEQALGIVERLDTAKTPTAAGRAFFDALAPLGARGFGARAYVSGGGSDSGVRGLVYAQILPPRWRVRPSCGAKRRRATTRNGPIIGARSANSETSKDLRFTVLRRMA